MNKLAFLGEPLNRLYILVICFFMSSSSTFAQEDIYTTIRKNINPLAVELDHNLSETQDSLLLENRNLFKKVRFLNKTNEKVFDFKPAVKDAKIPLNELPLGKYTVMFYQADKIIVFQIDRVLPFDNQSTPSSDVAMNDLADIDLESEVAMSIVRDNNLDIDISNLSLALNNADKNFEELTEHVQRSYNISDVDRTNMISRIEYRRTHLRPNGKPYYE